MISRDFFKNVDVFNVLDGDQLAEFEGSLLEKEYRLGDRLFAEGEDALYVWIIAEGRIDLRFELPARSASKETTISTLSESMIFGWSGLIPPYKYKLSAYCASSRAKIIRVNKDSLLDLFSQNTTTGYLFMSSLIQIVGKRFHSLQALASPGSAVKVKATVHMGTCGISAGAREVMNAFLEEKTNSRRDDIEIASAGCIGKCSDEPNVTIEIGGEGSVIYGNMNADRAREVFNKHLLTGEVISDYVLTEP